MGIRSVLEAAYWDLYFTIGFCCVSGAGNGIASVKEGGDFSNGFGEGFVNNVIPGLVVNAVYPLALNQLKATKEYRRNALIFSTVVSAGFVTAHYLMGTGSPLAAALPNLALGLAMTNRYVTETSDLEQRIEGKK